MPDFLTDDEIDQQAELSDDEMDNLANSFNSAMKSGSEAAMRGVGSVTKAVGEGLRYVDAYNPAGASLRAGIGAVQEGKPFGAAYTGQYGEAPEKAPSYSGILQKAGVTNKPIMTLKKADPFTGPAVEAGLADVGGMGLDMVTDPTTYISGPAGYLGAKGAVKGATKITPKVAEYLARIAEERAAKAATGQSVKHIRQMAKVTPQGAMSAEKAMGNLRSTGRALLEPGASGEAVMKPFAGVEEIAERAGVKTQQYGQGIGDIGKAIDAKAPAGAVQGKEIADDLMEYASSIPSTEGGKAMQERIMKEAMNFEAQGPLTFEKAQGFKNQFKFEPQSQDALISNKDVTNRIKKIIGKRMDSAVETVGSPDDLAKYQLYKDLYGKMKSTTEAASARSMQNLANRVASPSSQGLGAATMIADVAGGAGGLASTGKGLMAGMANQFALNRGNSTTAVILDKISKSFAKAGPAADKYAPLFKGTGFASPEGFLMKHKLLMQSDPEYVKIIAQGNTGEDNGGQ